MCVCVCVCVCMIFMSKILIDCIKIGTKHYKSVFLLLAFKQVPVSEISGEVVGAPPENVPSS